jgi:hypothetical protein
LRKLLPETWKNIKNEQVEAFVHLLDYENKAYVELVKVFLFVAMSGYPLPTADQIEQYNLDLTNFSSLREASLDHLSSTKAWFDE